MQGLYKLGYNPLKNNLLISDSIRFYYKPKHLGVSNLGLFPKDHEDYAHYASEQGYLRIKPFVECNDFGIYGSLALGNPPATKNLDAWSASKRAGVWDYWGFLQFSTVPNGAGGKEIVIFFEKNTFFDRPLEIIDRINISDQEASEDIEKLWDNFVDELNTRYGLAPIEEQKWLSDGIVFDIHSPDEI